MIFKGGLGVLIIVVEIMVSSKPNSTALKLVNSKMSILIEHS